MFRRAVRMTGVCLVAVAALGLTACHTGPVLEGTLRHAETGAPLDGIPVRVYSSTEENVLVAHARTGEDGTYRVRAGLLADAGAPLEVVGGDQRADPAGLGPAAVDWPADLRERIRGRPRRRRGRRSSTTMTRARCTRSRWCGRGRTAVPMS
jgi:hypothetical protein